MRVFYLHALPSLSTSIQSRMFWYAEVNMRMFRSRVHIMSLVILACFAVGTALAQNQAQPQSTKPPATSTTKMEDVSKWTQKQWDAAKAKWSEEKAKWDNCQKQAKQAKLSGRKSWRFLYDCMTK
jgi:hypothetical protein